VRNFPPPTMVTQRTATGVRESFPFETELRLARNRSAQNREQADGEPAVDRPLQVAFFCYVALQYSVVQRDHLCAAPAFCVRSPTVGGISTLNLNHHVTQGGCPDGRFAAVAPRPSRRLERGRGVGVGDLR
jgi:hypothetical protein